MDENAMREAIAIEYGLTLYKHYSEDQAAHLINIDKSTLKRWRRDGRTQFIAFGPRKIRYFGYHIADMLMKGVKDDG